MRLHCTVDCLVYLVIFLLYLKISACVSFDVIKPMPATISSPGDLLKTIDRNGTNEDVANSKADRLKHSFEECHNSFSWFCLKAKFVRLLENITAQQEFRLIKGITLVKDPDANETKTADLMADAARSYPKDPDARLNGYLINKVYNTLQTHYLRFKLIDDQIKDEEQPIVGTGRKDKFGKKGGMEALIAAGLVMKGTLMAMGMASIALIAGKALMTALMALTMAAVVGLKSLESGGGKSHTYEIVAKPIYTSSHSHSLNHDDGGYGAQIGHSGTGYGGYARSLSLVQAQGHRDKFPQ